ncbi:uncharacterized protein FOMMEDRAFT_21054 [Fomitiporia mediterranea MF3/22]|uniref:uncharacterized protein n=1 Tax=Fomitiporia mediterranea (strain MF3/22) TaxID=694068 RepID=UPI000440838E|nr:uncharacterized protein FOMMEDRAFT_21054 [Fomitiporia mediterranea MF3/22]EJD02300.1 hypothetical protein FOMMEDRAFT_21054 [Fomitiporia mediterranea MF3/22]
MSAHETYPVDEEPQPRSSIESRRSRMSKMTSNSVEPMPPIPSAPPLLPETKLDVSLSFDSIIGDINFEGADVDPKKKELMEKRQSNVLKLAEENEKLNAELKAMSERLAAAERRTQAILAARERKAKQGLENSEGGQQHQQHQHQQGTSAGAF